MANPRWRQVAALPFRLSAAGSPEVLVITSRKKRRIIIPKGWPMKGRLDYEAAAVEARQEAGLIGTIQREPVGSYTYWKRFSNRFDLVDVTVYLLEVSRQLDKWREQHARQTAWYSQEEAARLVDEPQLVDLIQSLTFDRDALRNVG
jgi:8-oxo-dGTP pyrophosphatase MutT (NUDIX family)